MTFHCDLSPCVFQLYISPLLFTYQGSAYSQLFLNILCCSLFTHLFIVFVIILMKCHIYTVTANSLSFKFYIHARVVYSHCTWNLNCYFYIFCTTVLLPYLHTIATFSHGDSTFTRCSYGLRVYNLNTLSYGIDLNVQDSVETDSVFENTYSAKPFILSA